MRLRGFFIRRVWHPCHTHAAVWRVAIWLLEGGYLATGGWLFGYWRVAIWLLEGGYLATGGRRGGRVKTPNINN